MNLFSNAATALWRCPPENPISASPWGPRAEVAQPIGLGHRGLFWCWDRVRWRRGCEREGEGLKVMGKLGELVLKIHPIC